MNKLTLLLLPFLAACVQYEAVDPAGVKVERILGAGYMEEYKLTGAGLACSGSIRASQFEKVSVRTVPLKCADGSTGTAEVTYASSNRAMQVNTNVTVAYRLSNGRTGTARV